ncbi:Ppx/GppA phosphatase family-domain-containing protein [Phycomyces nitens]|nr:Ppx/GppA phosphatase family-domain-containing protein [Phycomyces nitens]
MTGKIDQGPFGVVDMGSNGIRFSIIKSLERHLPVAYEERAPISLLESQTDDNVIPKETIDRVITSFIRFKQLCEQAGVKPENIHVIATEATRVAANSKEFLDRIYHETSWTVRLLTKREEALISASGIVGSFYSVNGLTMDLGGGSVELSYVIKDTKNEKDGMKVCKNPMSMPYGAAALKRRLAKCENKNDRKALYTEVEDRIKKAFAHARPPEQLKENGGYRMYMSGGGFRALGYLSMEMKAQDKRLPSEKSDRRLTYPIPIINGYTMTGEELASLVKFYKKWEPEDLVKTLKVFRISKRRASMIPASCFLLSAIMNVIPINRVYFSEGGVRQGFCYQQLSVAEQQKDPLMEGIKAYSAGSLYHLSTEEHKRILKLLVSTLPKVYMDPSHPLQLHRLLPAAIYIANMTSHFPKESRAFVAFHMPLASGPLANVPGLDHHERAILSLLMAYRQGGAIPDPIFYTIQKMVGRKGIATCKYIGRLMELVFIVSPLEGGVGLLFKSGLDFSLSPIAKDFNMSESDTDIGDEEDEISLDKNYPTVNLKITLPKNDVPMVDAPAVMSVIESFNKNIHSKKYDIDDDFRPQHFQLFNVLVEDPSP